MLRFLFKCKSLTPIKNSADSTTRICSSLQNLQFLCRNSTDCSSSTTQHSSFTVRDLINSCGLSDRLRVRSNSSERPNLVLELLSSSGFSKTQIKTIVSKSPKILFSNAQQTLQPKIDFLRSVGISEADVANMVSADPVMLLRSLKNHLIPSLDLLRTLLGSKQIAVDAIKRSPTILRYSVSKYLAPNVATLRKIGVPNSRISNLITGFARVMAGATPDRFSNAVLAAKEMGFDPLSSAFDHVVILKAYYSESAWKRRLEFYGSLGFTDEEIISMMRKQPRSMRMSEEKMRETVEFYMSKFHWSISELSKRPNILMYSLEKRIVPRCSVLQVLVSGSRVVKSVSVSSILNKSERDFLQRYVIKYKDEIPQVLDAYQGRLNFDEYDFHCERTK